MTDAGAVLAELRGMARPETLPGMARFGIATGAALGGIPVPALRALARRLGRDHGLAEALWASGVHEARLLACMVDDPAAVTEEQAERWAAGFDSWDVVDTACGDLLDRTPLAWGRAVAWSQREEEFVKRAGFVLMAGLAVHDRAAPDAAFLAFLPLIEREASERRNVARKGVNWALRQIGKRNAALNAAAIATAERILADGPRAARWVASDALRELRSETVQRRIAGRERARTADTAYTGRAR